MVKILTLDIETAPNIAYVWRFFKENISPNQILEHCDIMCFAAKWLDSPEVMYFGMPDSEQSILETMNKLLDQADMIVGHNLSRFDAVKIRGRSLVHGLELPSPYKEIDTYQVARKEFGFDGNSLDYLTRVFKIAKKDKHKEFPGFELWSECMAGNKKAWDEMRKYNIQDVLSTEELYLQMRPYMRNHPSVGVLLENEDVTCPKCGSIDNERRGFYMTTVSKFQRYHCRSCGGWHRSRFTEYPKHKRHALTVNAV
jgi:hypothetical protein